MLFILIRSKSGLALVPVFLWLMAVPVHAMEDSKAVRVDEAGIRRSAYKTVQPVYPDESLKRHSQGVVVVELEYDGNGNVKEVKVLQAPDPTIGQATIDAVQQWKFRRSTWRGKPLDIKGKLTFYFVIDRVGHGRVENPKQFR